jgi:histidinol-phosphate aminotransferase
MSKSYGLAGLRCGWAMASEAIIALFDKVRDSYNVNRLSQAGALAALEDEEYHQWLITTIKATRAKTLEALRGMGFEVFDPAGNFLFAGPPSADGRPSAAAAASLYEFYRENKILVRYFPGDSLTEKYLRISIGTAADMETLLNVTQTWLKNAKAR